MATTLFENAALLDVEAGLLRPGTWVLVEDEARRVTVARTFVHQHRAVP
jgi:hypothetical protein